MRQEGQPADPVVRASLAAVTVHACGDAMASREDVSALAGERANGRLRLR